MRLTLLAVLLLTGCATTRDLSPQWAGQSADAFFARHGPPARSHKMNNGGHSYFWENKGQLVDGSDVHCTLNITTDPAGKITHIRTVSDTIGKYKLSRCNEALGQ